MAKFTLPNILSGFLSITQLNNNFTEIENEFNDNVLYRNNPAGEPNAMQNPLDMNQNRILNLPAPQGDTEPARFIDVKNGVNVVGQVLPSFIGNTDRVLGTDGTNLVFKKADLAFDNYAELTIRVKSSLINGERVFVRGRTTNNDGGAGSFIWNATATDTPDGANILQADEGGDGRWFRDKSDFSYFDVRYFGGTASTGSIQAALDAAEAAGGGIVFLPAGTYTPNSDLTIASNVSLVGEGPGATIINPANLVTNALSSKDFGVTKQRFIGIYNLSITAAVFNDFAQGIRMNADDVVIDNVQIAGSGSVLGIIELNDGKRASLRSVIVDGFNGGSPGPGVGIVLDNFDQCVGDVQLRGLATGISMANDPLANSFNVSCFQCTVDGVILGGTDNTVNGVFDTCATRWIRITGTFGNEARVVRGSNVAVPANPVVIDSGSQNNIVVTREVVQDNSAGQNTILGAETQLGTRKYEKVLSFADLDVTPSVAAGNIFQTANTGATVITDFDDGLEGQRITVFVNDANTDFTHSASLNLSGAVDWTTAAAGDTIEFLNVGSNWYEVSRSDNT